MAAGEPRETRLRRLGMRSWRRGMREVDLILGPFADAALGRLDPAALDAFEALLEESDQELYRWLSATANIPPQHLEIVGRIREELRLS